MRTKKTALAVVMFLAVATLVHAGFASAAQEYTPLVKIPGVPDGPVNLSLYLVGLYNFLLSVVGIVAVLMLIIGGMRYITAAGNQAAISDAKDIITNALAGLLLAILSWVIVAEINPDVLYIKKPSGALEDTQTRDHGSCAVSFNEGTNDCVCKDGDTITADDRNDCYAKCRMDHCRKKIACYSGSDMSEDSGSYFKMRQKGKCICADGEHVKPDMNASPKPTTCEDVCTIPAMAGEADGVAGSENLYHGVKIVLDISGFDADGETVSISETTKDSLALKVNKNYLFDFSDSYDCKGKIVSFAVNFNGKATFLDTPDRWCCMRNDANCPNLWGKCCNPGGCSGLDGGPPKCNDAHCRIIETWLCTYFEPNEDNSNYPIFEKSFSIAESLLSSKREIWAGVVTSISNGVCYDKDQEIEKFFSVTLEN